MNFKMDTKCKCSGSRINRQIECKSQTFLRSVSGLAKEMIIDNFGFNNNINIFVASFQFPTV